jgi:hypothetical protein
VLTLTANASYGWILTLLRWSYSAAPTGGSITVAWGANSEVFAVAAAGPGFLPYDRTFPVNTTVTVTLAAGGSGITGTIYGDAYLDL